jgi:hypothetical protein
MSKRTICLFLLVAIIGAAWLLTHLIRTRPAIVDSANKPVVESQALGTTEITQPNVLATNAFNWKSVESPSYAEYVANLRKIGCPEKTVEDIIIADVNELFLDKAKPILASLKLYLLESSTGAPGKRERSVIVANARTSLKPLDVQRLELISAVLQHSPDNVKAAPEPWARLLAELLGNDFPYLSLEKTTEVNDLKAKADDLIKSKIRPGAALSREQMQFVNQVERQLQNDIAALLTPEEYDNYLVQNSGASKMLSRNLSGIPVTDEEFRKLLHIVKDQNAAGSGANGQPGAIIAMLSGLPDSSKIRAVLGDERYQDYKRQTDPLYPTLNTYASQNDLTQDQVKKLYASQKAATQAALEVQQSQQMGDDDKATKISRILGALEDDLGTFLTPRQTASYFNSGAGAWAGWMRKNPNATPPNPSYSQPMMMRN